MSRDSVTLSYKQIGAIALVIMNLVIIGPGGFLLRHFWNESKTFKDDTELTLDDLKEQINQLQVDLSGMYVTRKSFSDYREQMGETIRHLDSKITP